MTTPEKNREQKNNFTTELMTGKQLLEEINSLGDEEKVRFYPLDYTEIGEDYEEIKKPGVFHYSPLDWLSDSRKEGITYSVLRQDGKIIGLAQLEQSPYEGQEDVLWLKSVCIDETMKGQRQGFSEKLLTEAVQFAKQKNKKLEVSRFTKEGEERLKRKLKELTQKFGVEVVNPERLS